MAFASDYFLAQILNKICKQSGSVTPVSNFYVEIDWNLVSSNYPDIGYQRASFGTIDYTAGTFKNHSRISFSPKPGVSRLDAILYTDIYRIYDSATGGNLLLSGVLKQKYNFYPDGISDTPQFQTGEFKIPTPCVTMSEYLRSKLFLGLPSSPTPSSPLYASLINRDNVEYAVISARNRTPLLSSNWSFSSGRMVYGADVVFQEFQRSPPSYMYDCVLFDAPNGGNEMFRIPLATKTSTWDYASLHLIAGQLQIG
jgi:hypothetical protein